MNGKTERSPPYSIRGARQVGKSYLVEEFCREEFEFVAKIDFENRPELIAAFDSREPKEIVAKLEVALHQPIQPRKTLLFLDEIQICPESLRSLRYFREKMPDLHVIAAGSLLEFLLNDKDFSFPVGRVEFLYLHPCHLMSFYRLSPFHCRTDKTVQFK